MKYDSTFELKQSNPKNKLWICGTHVANQAKRLSTQQKWHHGQDWISQKLNYRLLGLEENTKDKIIILKVGTKNQLIKKHFYASITITLHTENWYWSKIKELLFSNQVKTHMSLSKIIFHENLWWMCTIEVTTGEQVQNKVHQTSHKIFWQPMKPKTVYRLTLS